MFVFKTYLVCLSICTRFAFSEGRTFRTLSPSVCPKHQGSDPSDVNDRVSKFASKDSYTTQDQDNKYIINICMKNTEDSRAVLQHGFKWKDNSTWTTVGTYDGAHVTGGTDWLMIKYFHGEKYTHHCSGLERMAVVLITCDYGEQMGIVKIIEEYRNRSTTANPLECYYLFELNHDAACSSSVIPSIPKHDLGMSPSSICLVILIVLGLVYLLLGFLYQRYVVGAKGLEQIPNCCFWTNFASLQACGCNCLCPCCESSPMTSQAWTTHSNDDQDERSMPVLL